MISPCFATSGLSNRSNPFFNFLNDVSSNEVSAVPGGGAAGDVDAGDAEEGFGECGAEGGAVCARDYDQFVVGAWKG